MQKQEKSAPCLKCKRRERAKSSTYCKPCKNEYQRQYRERNKDKVDESKRRYQRKNQKKISHRQRAVKYGLTVSELDALLEAKVCAICGEPGEHIDHCHATGKVRGLLCSGCNKSLGLMRDDPDRLRAAAVYLEKAAQ